MSAAAKSMELHPSAAPRRLARPDGFKTASVSVGLSGDAIRLLVKDESAEALVARSEQPGWASFPKTHTEEEYFPILSVSGDSGSREARLVGMKATFPKIEMLPNNEFLVVASRCWCNSDGSHEMNAKVYGGDGQQKREFLLGDGISHVQTDVEGHIWVGYFDEGVYGNFGWQEHSGGHLGAAGLSCFTKMGRKMWDYKPPEGFDHISDCYALNVSRTGVWSYYYTNFPIAFIDSNWRVRCWNTKSSGGRTFAVGDNKVLLYGGYGDHRTTCNLLSLDDDNAELAAQVSLALPRGIDPTKDAVIGRDKGLHVFLGDDWYVFSLDSLG
jgi:hypothetical protein